MNDFQTVGTAATSPSAEGNYIDNTDVDNWPDGISNAAKLIIIRAAENMIEKLTKDYFYAKPFAIVRDGNGKNRMFLGLIPNILSVTEIKVSGVTMVTSLYAFDDDAIFRAIVSGSQCKAIEGITLSGSDPVSVNVTSHGFITGETARLISIVGFSPLMDGEFGVTKTDDDNFTLNGTDSSDYTGPFTSGTVCFATLAELHYQTGREADSFVKGLANIEIAGTYGWATCPAAIKQVAVILCRYENDGTLYTKYDDVASDRLGDASYNRADKKFLMGIHEADRLIRNYIRKKPVLCAV